MADGKVSIAFTGSADQAARALAELEKRYEKLQGTVGNLTKRSKAGHDGLVASVTSWATKVVSVGAAYNLISGAIRKAIGLQDELIRKVDEFSKKQDRRTRSFAVNAGIGLEDAKKADARMRAISVRTGVPLETLEPAASALVGSGFATEQASGQSLERLVEMRNVTGGGDIDELAGYVSGALKAQGLKQTPENIQRVASAIYGARKAGDTEAKSMEFLARKLAIAKDTSLEENLALFTVAKDVTGGSDEVAATAFGSIQSTLRAPTPKLRDYMKKRNLDPLKMDFQGENTQQVLDYIHNFVKALPDEGVGGKNDTYTRLFGQGNVGIAKHIFDNPARFTEVLKATGNKGGYGEAVKIAQGGGAAAAQKVANIEEAQLAGRGTDATNIMKLVAVKRREEGQSEWGNYIDQSFAHLMRNFSDQSAVETLFNNKNLKGTSDKDLMQILTEYRQLKGSPLEGFSQEFIDAVEKNTAMVEQNNQLMQKQNQLAPKRAKVAAVLSE